MGPIDVLRAVCEAWNRLDNDALAELFAEEGVFLDPFHGEPLVGRDRVRVANAPAMAALADCAVELTSALEQGELGLAEGTFRARPADGTGRLDFPFAMVVELREGRIARLAEYFDTGPLT